MNAMMGQKEGWGKQRKVTGIEKEEKFSRTRKFTVSQFTFS